MKIGEEQIFFFCKKKLITGPLSLKSMIVTMTIQLVPLILFMSFIIKVCILQFINLDYIAIQKFQNSFYHNNTIITNNIHIINIFFIQKWLN